MTEVHEGQQEVTKETPAVMLAWTETRALLKKYDPKIAECRALRFMLKETKMNRIWIIALASVDERGNRVRKELKWFLMYAFLKSSGEVYQSVHAVFVRLRP